MPNITLIVLIKNEEENLKKWKWINKLKKINEVIIVDDESTDNSTKIINYIFSKHISIKIFKRKLNNNFAAQRNFGISKATNDWVFFLDADESPSPKLINFLNVTNLVENYCYSFNRYLIYQNNILYHGISATDKPIRLFNKNYGKFCGSVHEIWSNNKKIINIKQPLFHYSFLNLKTFLNKLNIYSTIRANELFIKKTKFSPFDIFLYPIAKFFQNYFWHLGFIDGIPGLITCLSLSFYSFLARSKLWQLYQK